MIDLTVIDLTLICHYCGLQADRPGVCSGCGAPIGDVMRERDEGPFYHEGYIVWPVRDSRYHVDEYYFFRGDQLIDCVSISHEALEDLVPRYCDPAPTIFEIFKVQVGIQDAARIKKIDRYRRCPVIVTVTAAPGVECDA